ncbi:TnsD family Tn7-like transposition protein [Lyngbya aestuarii]|uniref:TnsD family Tn7-like transposition protein n=1 Tax=Lyngbya aestuarii TaxID=118322 RepID=UPI00403DE15B
MVSFFPKPYPDEILYSVMARYHIRSANTSPKVTLRELFNSPSTIATADLPSNLNILSENLQFFSNYTVEELIYKYTLYPFYSVFLPPKRAIQVKESMKAEQGGDIHTRAGIMASSVAMSRYFRFCPNCLEEDLQKYGEAYWHRLHQIPGVVVCPVHAVMLKDSTVPIQGFNKHEYQAASLKNCPITPNQQLYSNDTLENLLLLAQDISWLMNTKLSAKQPEWFRRRYVALLIEKGLATVTGRVNRKRLLDNFLFFYGHEMLEALNSTLNYQQKHNWLLNIVRKPRKSFHPIRHLLMIRFLAGSLAEFFNIDYDYKPFGDAPWLCLNAAADHYLQPVVTDLAISNCCDTKKPVGTFRCSCGMIYCRTGPDTTEDDQYRIGKIKAYGTVWEHKLRELVEVQRLGLRATARQLRVATRTVKRYALLLKLDTSWQSCDEYESVPSQEQPEDDLTYSPR